MGAAPHEPQQPGQYPGHPYPGQPYAGQPQPPGPYGPYGPYPPAPRPPARTSLVGPVVLTGIGAFLLVAAVVVAVLVVRTFLSIVPLGVLDAGGGPGSASVASTSAPGTTTAQLAAGYHHLYLVVPSDEHDASLVGVAQLTGPDGTTITGEQSAIDGTATMGGNRAVLVAGFSVLEAGEYTLTVPEATTPDAQVVLVEGPDFAGFISGVFGTVGGVFLAIALGVIGFGLTVGGVIWWVVRARARRRVVAGPQPF
ncbi:hypothetical protein [Cellulomonas palmilytica]|uniref:hypothetical protein n=1 Tax=Cellulomonas palmilytica TaxID=2608402 RepID=UPI001F3F88E9|nr:hypothetical protein [Cellulomonas palmilytica]UJP40653.1 hypothetical protein F1D97_03880 [Cellulomonas palmilytica]